jgi:enediyne biosynthesis protein E4
LDVHFFDADGDGDLDIYTASGSNEFAEGSPFYQDHLYLNNGKGIFSDATNRIPKLNFSKSVVRSSDIDKDGDLDLFIGGRLVPGKYGLSERSFILINNKGHFIDKTNEILPLLSKPFECVTDAIWVDLDKDGYEDLVVVGEWAPVRIFKNSKTGFKEVSSEYKTDSLIGWWNTIQKCDLNGDGHIDLVLGNLGTNSKFKASIEKPFMVYVNDFDNNGSWDTYLATYSPEGKIYPVRGRQCSSEQMPFISDKFKTYNQFAKASVEEILDGKMKGSTIKKATILKSIVLFNNGNGSFTKVELPPEAQMAPVHSIAFYDFNKDGILDILLGGNYYNWEIETARTDASIGQILINSGQQYFLSLSNSVSGLKLFNDLRELRIIQNKDKALIIAANNNEKLQAFKIK